MKTTRAKDNVELQISTAIDNNGVKNANNEAKRDVEVQIYRRLVTIHCWQ